VPSALSRRLAAEPGHEAMRAFRAARSRFLAGERVDMGQLAAELGVDRTSLFRWVGNRDALLSEVLWSLAAPTLDSADAATPGGGPDRVAGILTSFVTAMIDASYFREFLRREPSRAMRLLTTTGSAIQRRYVALTETLLEEEVTAGRLRSPLPLHDLAYLLVRLSESFTYADLIAGEEPSGERAAATFAFVLEPTRMPEEVA
jgi:AcrR family transcriptional regulator